MGLSTQIVEDGVELTAPYWGRKGPRYTVEAAGDLAAGLLRELGGFDRAVDNWNTAKVLASAEYDDPTEPSDYSL